LGLHFYLRKLLNAALISLPKLSRNQWKALQRRLQVFGDFCSQDFRFGQIVDVFQAVVFEPEQVEVEFVAFDQVFDGEAAEAVGFFAGFVAVDEVVEVFGGEFLRF